MRLDKFLFENNFYSSRNKAFEAIARGEVFVNGKAVTKPSSDVTENDDIKISSENKPYVSLGGYKLACAVEKFSPEIDGKVFIDVGASTGGFTDCLLRNGAKKVYCVDVGEGLLDKSITADPKVVVMDNTNARFLTEKDFDEKADGIVVDCSFISLEYIIPPLPSLLNESGYILALIKPQFETGGKTHMKHGVLRDDKERYRILEKIYSTIISYGLKFRGLCLATKDDKKNKEYIAYISKSGENVEFDEAFSSTL